MSVVLFAHKKRSESAHKKKNPNLRIVIRWNIVELKCVWCFENVSVEGEWNVNKLMFPRQSTLGNYRQTNFSFFITENYFNFSSLFNSLWHMLEHPRGERQWEPETFRLFLMSRKLFFPSFHTAEVVPLDEGHLTTHFTVSWTEFFIFQFNFTNKTI